MGLKCTIASTVPRTALPLPSITMSRVSPSASVRHHPGFGVERSREFIEVEGEVENLVVEDCRVAEIACM